MKTIKFKPMTNNEIPLWNRWITKPHVRDVWFIEGYEPADYVHQKIIGNGYDYPFIITIDDNPIGYIVYCDLYAYRTLCAEKKGLFKQEEPGTFCMDLFIAEENYLDKGYGTQIVKKFAEKIFHGTGAKIIYIDPAITNKRAIRCYEKAGFEFAKIANDGVCDCYVMRLERNILNKLNLP